MIVISIYCRHGRRNATYNITCSFGFNKLGISTVLPTNIQLLATHMAETLLDKFSCNNKTYYTIAKTKHMLDSLLTNTTAAKSPPQQIL